MTKLEECAAAIHAVEFEPGDFAAAATMDDPALRDFRMAQTRAVISTLRRPDMAAIMRAAGQIAMRPSDVDLAVTHYLDALLKEDQ